MTLPPSSTWTPLAWGALSAAAFLQALWFVQRRHRDGGIADVGWALSIGGMAIAFALIGPGSGLQRALAGGLGGLWGLRLGLHLLFDRVIGKEEDGRYQAMRRHWGDDADRHFLWFFQLQAFAATVMAIPFLLAAGNPSPRLATVQIAGLLLFVVAQGGVALADRQLARWRRDPAHRGRTCRTGLWRYSRHPNYFFEWLVWCAFALVAWPAPGGALALFAPVLLYVLVTRVTGIPYTEAQALRSRGDDYRRYQATTSPFFPWFPREENAPCSP